MLSASDFATDRRSSSARPAKEAEVDDIANMFTVVDRSGKLDDVRFAAIAYDRLPRYGPEELNVAAVVDRQLRTEQCITDIANKLAIFDNFGVPAQTSLEPITEAVNRVDAELRASTRCLQEQITQLSTICSNLAQSRTPPSSPTSSPASRPQRAAAAGPATQIDRSRNVVITGIAEDRDSNVWKSKVVNILGITVGREVGISDCSEDFCIFVTYLS